MKLKTPQLENYRNYKAVTLNCHPRVDILTGENTQGKTNLLESIYVPVSAKGHRTANDKELIRFNSGYTKIEGELSYRHGIMSLAMYITKKGKQVKVNHLGQSRSTQYVGHLNVALSTPKDLNIAKGSPQIRRRFVDMELGQISAVYLSNLAQYQRIPKQKNSYLKQSQLGQKTDKTMLGVLNQQLAQCTLNVTLGREQLIEKLGALAQPIHAGITNQRETLSPTYLPSTRPSDTSKNKSELLDKVTALSSEYQQREMDRVVCLYGPHRDDLGPSVNDMGAQTCGSQDQQRATALSIKLAETELMNIKVGEYPILLLDNVLSEFDDSRQTHLFSAIQYKVQTFVTITSVDGIDHEVMNNAKLYRVDQGETIK